MANIEKIEKSENEQINNGKNNKIKLEVEEVGLEDLIILGESKKIPIHMEYPNQDGSKTSAKALVKQLTLKEIDKLKLKKGLPVLEINKRILKLGLYKSTGEPFTFEELDYLPIGLVEALANKISELSGADIKTKNKLEDF